MLRPTLLLLFAILLSLRVIAQESWLSHYDLSEKSVTRFNLPGKLSEASGLTMTANGRLLAHDDENGAVYQVDYSSGAILKQFSIGSALLRADFEDIACVGERIYMVTSDGDIYEFREGQDGERKTFQLYKTALSRENDVEGLSYDPATNCLLLACKGNAGSGLEKYKAVYSFSLSEKKLLKKPRFLLAIKSFDKIAHKGHFNPSGIARHPKSGTFFIISADGEAIIEISATGKLLSHQKIPKKINDHPEGITFTPDLTMILCNDGQGGVATLTLYPVNP